MVDKQAYKCAYCKHTIEVNINNITGVISFKDKYYHIACFEDMATKKACSKRGKPEMWRDALYNIQNLKAEAKEKIKHSFARDNLNEWLLNHYNITKVPCSFWQRLADLERGIYQSRRCKPVSMEVLLGAWQWGQVTLNKINNKKKMNHNGHRNDDTRLVYDLAIIVGKIPEFLAYKAKQDAFQAEIKTPTPRINYNNMQRTEIKHEGLGDISDLLDDDDD